VVSWLLREEQRQISAGCVGRYLETHLINGDGARRGELLALQWPDVDWVPQFGSYRDYRASEAAWVLAQSVQFTEKSRGTVS